MMIIKRINGHTIELIIDKIEDQSRGQGGYSIYQVSKMVNGEKRPLYKECFTDSELREIENNGYDVDALENFDDSLNIDLGDDEDELEKLLAM